jgi:hypothetical protein
VQAHFLGVVPTAVDEIWLDCNGTPLRWHFAVGVLFDLHNDSLLPPIPWQITVHFSSFPEDRLIRLTGVEALKTIFMSSLKAANFLKFGDGGKVFHETPCVFDVVGLTRWKRSCPCLALIKTICG